MHRLKPYLLASLLTLGCGKPNDPEKGEPNPWLELRYEELVDRLVQNHLSPSKFVISKENGETRHEGDALIWTGITLGALPCEQADLISVGLRTAVKDNGGYLRRFEPLPDRYLGGREISLDGAIGVMFGVALTMKNCPSLDLSWFDDWWMQTRDGELYPGTGVEWPPAVDWGWELLAHRRGLRGKPAPEVRRAMEIAMTGWVKAVKESQAAAFRAHLATLIMMTSDVLGETPRKNEFCSAADGIDLGLTEWWCGRKNPDELLLAWEMNVWEYQWQRAPKWEMPDGKGFETPAVDYLILWRLAKQRGSK